MRSGSLCALLWRLLSWCHPRGIVLRARHIPGRLNVIADKLSRHNQVIQTEWSLDQRVFNLLCSNWGLPQVDLFATRFNFKIPRFVSESALGGSGGVCLSLGLPAQPSGLQGGGSGLSQNDSDSSRMAQHALVLGPGESICSGSLPAPSTQESDYSAIQRASTQEPQQLESSCLAPRSCVIQEQGFTDEVAPRMDRGETGRAPDKCICPLGKIY